MTDPAPQRVFLVLVDATPEMRVALRYAARRARNVGGRLVLLHVVEPTDKQHWRAVESLMREENLAEAEQLMGRIAAEAAAITGALPVVCIREGHPRDEILALIDEDPSISILVLAAEVGEKGPGPLVQAFSGRYIGRLRVPVTIVPGSLGDSEIDALS